MLVCGLKDVRADIVTRQIEGGRTGSLEYAEGPLCARDQVLAQAHLDPARILDQHRRSRIVLDRFLSLSGFGRESGAELPAMLPKALGEEVMVALYLVHLQIRDFSEVSETAALSASSKQLTCAIR